MKQTAFFSRILLGLAYLVYGYIHFSNMGGDESIVPNGIGLKAFWVILIGICWWAVALSFFTNIMTRLSGLLASLLLMFIFIFVVLPHFHGINSLLSVASIFALIGGSVQVAAQGRMWYHCKSKE